jgi:arylsulfatase A-like enzyme/Tfp pilus assembly protein PilF
MTKTAPPPRRRSSRHFPVVAWLVAGLAAASGVGAWFLWRPAAPVTAPATQDNILLITIDTARADHFGAYGYAPARTRHIDQLAAEGVRFDRAFTTAPITLTAHASIFTGLYPFEHGVRNNGNFYLADRFETLATRLKQQGYRTAAFVSAFVLDRRYGLARGFDVYDDRMQGSQPQVVSLEAERRGDRTELALTAWLDGDTSNPGPRPSTLDTRSPFFVWLHLYDPHEPYRPPPPFRDAFAGAPYDGEIAFTDAIVADLLDRLRAHGILDRTIIAVIGDHGESLGDHGEETHSMFVYDAAIRVPFILWRPGRLAPGVVTDPVRVIDLAPTLLELVGAQGLAAPHARSLVPLMQGHRESTEIPPIYAETYLPQFYLNWAPLRTLRDDRWKYIDAPKPELYDTSSDPGERENLYAAQPATAAALRGALETLTGGSTGAMNAGAIDRETSEKLAALGYIGAGAGDAVQKPNGAAPGGASQRRDPKDVIALFNQLRRANSAVRDRRFNDALPILRDVLQEDPGNAFAQLVLGSAYMGMGQYRQAVEQYRLYATLVPTSSYAHQWMAICYVRLGDQDAALREAAAALALDPGSADSHVLRGGIFASRGQYEESVRELRAAVATDPAKVVIRLDLAKVLDEAGLRDEAEREYLAILAQQPDYAPALTGLGALRSRQGRVTEAIDLLRRALQTDPASETARFDLARTLEQEGSDIEAANEYRRLLSQPATSPQIRHAASGRLRLLESKGRR